LRRFSSARNFFGFISARLSSRDYFTEPDKILETSASKRGSPRKQTEIASGFFLTGMTLGPDGALYVSNVGFAPPPNGLGQVLKSQCRSRGGLILAN
jgi:hypothetical protein